MLPSVLCLILFAVLVAIAVALPFVVKPDAATRRSILKREAWDDKWFTILTLLYMFAFTVLLVAKMFAVAGR